MPTRRKAEVVDLAALDAIEEPGAESRAGKRGKQRGAPAVKGGGGASANGGKAAKAPEAAGKARAGSAASSEGGGSGAGKKRPAKPKKRSREPATPSDQIYEINSVLDMRLNKGTREFLISWKGYGEEDNSWEPEHSFVSSVPIREFEERQREGNMPKKQKNSSAEGKQKPRQPHRKGSGAKSASAPESKVTETPARNSGQATKQLLALRKQDIVDRLVRRSMLEKLLISDIGVDLNARKEALMMNAIGLFVRLKVDSQYHVAQILEVYDNPEAKYSFGDAVTGIFLLVSFDSEKTMAKLSYISDGTEVSREEYNYWSAKLRADKLITTAPPPSGMKGNLAQLYLLAFG
uniref:Chromo domain-containing protein n=1 Tax=Rhizochromulina marina TaxID=1034831 RepID=A0A7S2WS97_9STRA|mmetsp:Transcript_3169/g.9176  ORF Transcript_3169/g.9176 Transcript_3169/m.9176 type:complete len:349 (+) Transcript_3169:157-1203(+)